MENTVLDDDFSPHERQNLNEINLNNVEFAGLWIRLGANLIDTLVMIPIFLLSIYNGLHFKSLLLMFMLTFLGALYKPYLEWKKSATFGKIAVGIKLVDESMNDINGEQAIKRYSPWGIAFLISITINVLLYMTPEFQNVDDFISLGLLANESPLQLINTIYSFVFIVLIGSLIFDSRKQGFHDKFAGTYCIKNK